jgi:hypothetical protein
MVDVSASATVRASREVVEEVVRRDLSGVLGGRPGPSGRRSALVELPMPLSGGAAIRQEVEVRVGAPESGEIATRWPVRWEPVGHRALAPTFAGHLQVVAGRWETELRLTGSYDPPLGLLGAVGDHLLRERAIGTVQELVGGLARRIDAAADVHVRRTGHARPPGVREHGHPLHPRG